MMSVFITHRRMALKTSAFDLDLNEIPPDGTGLLGTAYGGGFIVSKRVDKDSNPYILIDSGSYGDSVLREASSDGVPDSSSSGTMNFVKSGAYGDGTQMLTSSVASGTDGLDNTERFLTIIQGLVDASTQAWTDYPALNYIRLMRDEVLQGYDDWYIASAASSSKGFGVYSCDGPPPTIGAITINESEWADMFWYQLGGWDTSLNRCATAGYYDDVDVSETLHKFFGTMPGGGNGDHRFSTFYFSSTETSATNVRSLWAHSGYFGSGSKSGTSYRIRPVRRHYL